MRRPTPRRAKGFTLTELLVVVAIIGVIASFVVPAAGHMVAGAQLTRAVQIVSDELSLARQTALSLNRPIEVRFYQFGDPEAAGEKNTDANSGKYRAIQLFAVADSGTGTPIDKVRTLPAGIIIDSGSTLSSIIGAAGASPKVPGLTADSAQSVSIPRVGVHYNSVTFRFLPSGATDLVPPNRPWFITLHNTADQDALPAPPANFVTLQVDAYNGHLRTFRP